jgi:hypothetical protein
MVRLLLAVCLCALVPASCPAQGFIEHLEPPVLQVGKTTRLTAVGSGFGKALDLWTSLPTGKVTAKPVAASKPDQAVFDVTVSADAPAGVFGLRVATVDGLSNVHLCLMDDMPVRAAPDSGKGPAGVDLPCSLWGRFREAEVDRFAIRVKAGQVVSFEAVGNRLGKEVDPLVIIRDARNRIVEERDNDLGLYFDCRFAHRFAEAGTYTVEIRDSRFQGHEHGYYVLRMGRFPAARVAVPAAVRPGKRNRLLLPELAETVAVDVPAGLPAGPFSLPLKRAGDEGSTWLPVEVGEHHCTIASADAVSAKQGTKAKWPGQLCGVLTKPGERHFFQLELVKGQSIYVAGHGRWLNSSIDIDLALTDGVGRILRQASGGPDDTVRLDFTAGSPGVYCLAVRNILRDGGPDCIYRLDVLDQPPAPRVVAEVEGLTVPRDSYQPIALTVTRNGYAGPIALGLTGAPEGVTITPNEIPAGADSLVCRLSATATAKLGLHTIQLWAQPTKAAAQPKSVVRTRPLIDRQLRNVDLIPYGLREDQLRLPAALHDRLALQVTAPSPFTFELPEKVITLPRYQQAAIPILTTRKAGFDAAISFTAHGGQLADKEEGRTRVYAEFPTATAKTLKPAGSVHSRILSNLGKTRIEVLASARDGERRITLIRTFDLEIRTAFTIAVDPLPVKLKPGESAKVQIKVNRVKSFSGPVRVELSPGADLELPEKLTIPKDKESVEVVVTARATTNPGRRSIHLSASADVDGFEEEYRGARIDIDVPTPEKPKKK